jgi:hypothetical protein
MPQPQAWPSAEAQAHEASPRSPPSVCPDRTVLFLWNGLQLPFDFDHRPPCGHDPCCRHASCTPASGRLEIRRMLPAFCLRDARRGTRNAPEKGVRVYCHLPWSRVSQSVSQTTRCAQVTAMPEGFRRMARFISTWAGNRRNCWCHAWAFAQQSTERQASDAITERCCRLVGP